MRGRRSRRLAYLANGLEDGLDGADRGERRVSTERDGGSRGEVGTCEEIASTLRRKKRKRTNPEYIDLVEWGQRHVDEKGKRMDAPRDMT